MKNRLEWWPQWFEKKQKYARTTEKQMDQDRFNAICAGTGLPAIHQKSTFKFENVADGANRFLGNSPSGEKPFARIYTRLGNPNTEYLEKVLFQLDCQHIIDEALAADEREPTIGSLVFASGMAAISSTIMGFIRPGDALVVGNVYGCTDSFMRYLQNRFGIEIHFTDATNTENIQQLFAQHDNIVAVLLESPDNPTLRLADIEAISKITEANEALLIVDNTFCSPYLQQPFRLGTDIVIQSLTKYVNGHSASIAGVAIGPFEFFNHDLFLVYKDFGATPSPFDSWLNSLCLQDLGIRMEAQTKNAIHLAQFLEAHPKVKRVWYPFLESHPDYEVARKQMRNGGGMISFELKGGYDAGVALMNYFARPDTPMELAVSLGSLISYIEHPASMTHSVVPEADRCERGITDSLVRLSVGTEGVSILQKALDEGLNLG
ncbi:MAG: aminotransferase class I/II-fold pyridoxal phosphate-dependent enzyme [Cyclobacteriaceae bacterium]|nr:aminotransferase class I/II-fold pyridoxal phosphate-dependent enzyme [Cyclobacteriaceae bacterium]MCH8514864.1 aminotransferase class I/II-fold pyridoxal phosphate-dependent enzyme [Cyclobacteriaceae bacterium]